MVREINSWRPKSVRLSKASYFADFAVYPPVVLALLILALRQAPSLVWIEWSIATLGAFARARISIAGSAATRCIITRAGRATSA
jgi:hypothetical protein